MYIAVTLKRYRAVKEVGKIKMSVGIIAYYQLMQVCQVKVFPMIFHYYQFYIMLCCFIFMFLLIAVVRGYLGLPMAYDMLNYNSCLWLCLCNLNWNSYCGLKSIIFCPDFTNFLNCVKHSCKTMIILQILK